MRRCMKKVKTRSQTQVKKEDSSPFSDEHRGQIEREGSDPSTGEHVETGGCSHQSHSIAATDLSSTLPKPTLENACYDRSCRVEEATESFWEDGKIPVSGCTRPYNDKCGVTVEFEESPTSQRKSHKRFSAEEKESAEIVHRVHLLCLLGRGRLIDIACDDPLIQASLLSLLPPRLLKITESVKLTTNDLIPLVKWFQNNFLVQGPRMKGLFGKNLAFALASHEGTVEEVAALSVSLLRALNLPARFVSALDAVPLKPDSDIFNQDGRKLDPTVSSSKMSRTVSSPSSPSLGSSPIKRSHDDACRNRKRNAAGKKKISLGSPLAAQPVGENIDTSSRELCVGGADTCAMASSKSLPRKGDIEFEMQLEMALSATAVVNDDITASCSTGSRITVDQCKKMKNKSEDSVSLTGTTGAVWSRKIGPPLYWAEVFCSGENLTGRWVHIDAAAGKIDGEKEVEAAAAACRKPLRYVVAFAGNGAKDVTRRYCSQWYKIASNRVCSEWWDAVLAPFKELEASATGGLICSRICSENAFTDRNKEKEQPISAGCLKESCQHLAYQEDLELENFMVNHGIQKPKLPDVKIGMDGSVRSQPFVTRDSLEDMELATRALTEPLPTNQQAYRNHPLYALERWLTKYQAIHPKGPVLGYCSGHPVYPRGCVQTLHTKQKWLREGLQVKDNETPAKIIKRLSKYGGQDSEPDIPEDGCVKEDGHGTTELYGKWQTEPLCLPHAINGIVPKNERGQVDVWSEKCLPHGTVHLRMPRLVPVARRLEIDFAPAMVGFEFRNGRSFPVFEGIVVCSEYKDAILEAYAEEEERREAEEKKRSEMHALSRWYQLLSSIVTRQRLRNIYEATSTSEVQNTRLKPPKTSLLGGTASIDQPPSERTRRASVRHDTMPEFKSVSDHEHTFPLEDQSFDEESCVRTKRCPCGFSIQVEEL